VLDFTFDMGKIREILEFFGIQRDGVTGPTPLVRSPCLGVFFQIIAVEERNTTEEIWLTAWKL
jgi:hypothetical protein